MPQPPTERDIRFSHYPWWRKWFGDRSERAAAKFLRSLGWTIIARNRSDRLGELDIIAVEDRKTVVVVEVRSSAVQDFRELFESIDKRKQSLVTNAALRYLKSRHLLGKCPFRLDVVLIRWPAETKTPEIRHYRNAFETTGQYQIF